MLSIVIPTYNEEESVEALYNSVKAELDKIGETYEILFVDDGSRDRTFEILSGFAAKDANLKIIRFNRNFGQSAAISAGFKNAKGELIVTMDADMQNDPSDIPKLLEKMKEGNCDMACGWRKDRKDPLIRKKLPSKLANFISKRMTGIKIHDSGCTLRVYKKEVVKDMELYGEMHRYIPALASFRGYSLGEVEVKHHPREKGKTKYGMFRIFKGLSDLITLIFVEKYGTRPGHIFTSGGIAATALGIILFGLLAIYQAINPAFNLPNRTLLFISLLMVLGGVQFVTIGVLSEMVARVRYEISGKKFYEIKEMVNG